MAIIIDVYYMVVKEEVEGNTFYVCIRVLSLLLQRTVRVLVDQTTP